MTEKPDRSAWPEHGSFARPRPSGNVHIIDGRTTGSSMWATACGKAFYVGVLDPADGDDPRQCQACWEAM